MKLTRQEAGKLGYLASIPITEKAKAERVEHYNLSPKRCRHCGEVIPYNQRRKQFCDSSCSAKHTNVRRVIIQKTRPACLICGLIVKKDSLSYCSIICMGLGKTSDAFGKVEVGLVKERSTLKKYLMSKGQTGCASCKLEQWLGEPITLELDHIDGDASNNLPPNLRLICPNCHSTTPSWKGRNRGKGRKSRGLPLH